MYGHAQIGLIQYSCLLLSEQLRFDAQPIYSPIRSDIRPYHALGREGLAT